MWISILPAQLKQRLSGAEYNAITTAALNTSQDAAAMVTAEIARAVQIVRGFVGKRFALGEAGTIPDELEGAALALIVVAVLSRLPVASLLTEARTKAADDAMRLLRDVSDGKFIIVAPTDAAPVAEQPAPKRGTVAVISSNAPRYNRTGLGRLF